MSVSCAATRSRPSSISASAVRVALIGTGVIGAPLGMRILQAGHTLSVFNRTAGKAAALQDAGARVERSANRAITGAEIVVAALTDVRVLETVLFEAGGIANSIRQATLIDCSTSEPRRTQAVAARLQTMGVAFVEAPLAGSVHDVTHGAVTFLTGGDQDIVERVRGFLESIGRRSVYFGSAGSANAAKLALNLLVGLMAAGLGDAFAFCQAACVDIAAFLDVLAGSGLSSPLYERIGARYVARDFEPRFALKNLQKDMRYLEAHGRNLGLHSDLVSLLASRICGAAPALGEQDYSILALPRSERSCQ